MAGHRPGNRAPAKDPSFKLIENAVIVPVREIGRRRVEYFN
jgi:hypothetical protein